jgi:hypothetical protein
VGVGLVVVLVVSAVVTGCWAIYLHRRAFSVVGRTMTGGTAHQQGGPRPRIDSKAEAGAGRDIAQGQASVGQLAAKPALLPVEPVSVLGWESFVVLSVLFLDGTALVACRRVGSARRRAPAGFQEADQTMLLRLGVDHRAAAALAVFDDWRRRKTPLRLRPVGVPGAIEILDGAATRIRAPLADT